MNKFHYSQARLYDPTYTYRVNSEGRCQRFPAHSNTLRMLLGLKDKAKLPLEGMDSIMVQGYQLCVYPRGWLNPKARRAHRLVATCPHCGETMSAGRVNQHVCKDAEKAVWSERLTSYYLNKYGEAV